MRVTVVNACIEANRNMETLVVTAVFSSAEDAHRGVQELQAIGIADDRLRVSAGCVLHVRVTTGELERVNSELRRVGARDITASARPQDAGWMSHVTGRTTGSQVMPGEGDSEAGA
jgi:hypothetical protein